MKTHCLVVAWASFALLCAHSLRAEDAFYRVPLANLTFTEGSLPAQTNHDRMDWRDLSARTTQSYAVLDGEGEVYVGGLTFQPWMPAPEPYREGFLAIRAPADKEISGFLFVSKPDLSGMVRLPFKIAPASATPAAKTNFLETKEAHYRDLRARNIPGAAWFRHQEDEAIKARTGKAGSTLGSPNRFIPRGPQTTDDTYALFSGGRAVSENLQLERALPAARSNETMVDLAGIDGIKITPMDWKPLLAGLKPDTDPLAASIPADQHALFFPSFQAMMSVMDEADTNGTPLVQMIEPRSEDMDTCHRYQKQLCLGLTELSRRIGPQVVEAIAVTGSDPYLRMGTDVGVLFQTKNPDLLKSLIAAQQALGSSVAGSDAKPVHGEIEGVSYSGLVSPDRSVCSYIASVGNVVFVSNSLHQLGCLISANKGAKPALVSQDEYLFFRSRYARGNPDESAFLVLSDATIRRWCGPRWRIADSRRTRAAAALAELQAAQLDALVNGTIQPVVLHPVELHVEILTADGAAGVLGQEREQVEFRRRQVHLSAADGDAALPAIDLQRADHEGSDGLFAWRRAAQMGLQPRQQHSRADRLRQVVVGAGFEPQHLVDFFAAGGQHDDHTGVRVPHRLADRESVQSRQVDVQQNRVGTLDQDPAYGRVAAALNHGVASVLHEELRHHRGQRCIVFDEQNSMAWRFLVHRLAANCK